MKRGYLLPRGCQDLIDALPLTGLVLQGRNSLIDVAKLTQPFAFGTISKIAGTYGVIAKRKDQSRSFGSG